MSVHDCGEEEFERALLRSASLDLPEAEARRKAWSAFAARMAGLAMALEGVRLVSRPPAEARSVPRFSRVVAAAKWLVIGAIGGSAVTLALVGHPPTQGAISGAATSQTESPGATVVPSPSAATSVSASPEPEPSPTPKPFSSAWPSSGRAPAEKRGPLAHPRGSSQRASASPAGAMPSTLAAEVVALDAARSALGVGRPDEALTLLRRYFREFANGELVPEAEVIELEALSAKGEHAQVGREAARFLERYPNAPQREHVEQLRGE